MSVAPALLGDVISALDHPARLRIVAALVEGREYVSELARRLEISRPLLHMHLRRLEAAGLVVGHFELSAQGKALRFYDVAPFQVQITPQVIAEAMRAHVAGRDTGDVPAQVGRGDTDAG